jgi:hypothetical protein
MSRRQKIKLKRAVHTIVAHAYRMKCHELHHRADQIHDDDDACPVEAEIIVACTAILACRRWPSETPAKKAKS